ncbi:MAG: hypothetical protein EBW87_00145 [Burkholderiaceae bacterium]|nr:hypothetical protein [Burkholderiaceae bacterium]
MRNIPSLADLYNGILSNFETELGRPIPRFGKVFLRALAAVQAAKLKIVYLAIGKLQKNIFVDTADPESAGGTLERFGRIKLGRNRFPAQAAQYDVAVTGLANGEIPALTTFKSNDDSANPGKLFILDLKYVMPSTSGTIRLRALEAGTVSALDVGDILSCTVPLIGVNKTAEVVSEYVAPLDVEDLEVYRAKVVDAFQLEPNGGSPGDFRIWASDAQGVKTVYPYAKNGSPGEINVYVEASEADSTDGFGTPGSGILTDVESVLEYDPDTTKPLNERGRRPLGVFDIHVLPVSVKPIVIDIASFDNNTTDKQTAIFNAVNSRIKQIRPFIAGAEPLDRKNDTLNANIIISEILSVVPGSIFGAVTFSVDGVVMTSKTFINGDIPYLDSITYS